MDWRHKASVRIVQRQTARRNRIRLFGHAGCTHGKRMERFRGEKKSGCERTPRCQSVIVSQVATGHKPARKARSKSDAAGVTPRPPFRQHADTAGGSRVVKKEIGEENVET